MKEYDVVIVGAGFTGLTSAYLLSKLAKKVLVLEADVAPGGLAGVFRFNDGVKVEKFYHHWFNNDQYVPWLIRQLNCFEDIIYSPARTGMFYNGRIWKLSSPIDLLKFSALSVIDRLRLGMLVFRVRMVRDWKKIEHLSIREWLEPICGKEIYKIVWEPLIRSKFSNYSETISAVWMWSKLVLRGGTRKKSGGEELAYFKGGFGRLAEILVDKIQKNSGDVIFNCRVQKVKITNSKVEKIQTSIGDISAKKYLFTMSFPEIAKLFDQENSSYWLENIKSINYLANKCLVLRLKRSLSTTYWLNINDPGFPFVGVIEHTNFDSPDQYKGSHIVYLSRYMAHEDPLWSYTEEEYFEFAFEYLKKMFPDLDISWVLDYRVWSAPFAQPITVKNYSKIVPGNRTPYVNMYISTMAQIFPEDRGTNYAIRGGLSVTNLILSEDEDNNIFIQPPKC